MSEALAAMPDPSALTILSAPGVDAPHTLDLRDACSADAELDEFYAPPQHAWVRMNMIGSLNGRVTGTDGTSDTLSNRADRRILGRIRRMSDVIVVGARTVRQERHTTTRPTWLCVVTSSGDLTGHRISPEDAAASVLVCCPREARARAEETLPGCTVLDLEAPEGEIDLSDVLSRLRARGHEQVVVEGGNHLISQFLDAGLIDEVCLTQAPVFAPDSAPSLPGSGRGTAFERALLAVDSVGYVYQRLIARHDS